MDIRQLKFFLAVVDHNGFSRAAKHLMVAQPSLSQAIATFERELGMPLFHRIGRGVVLSEAGTALVGPARVVLRDLDEAKAAMRHSRDCAAAGSTWSPCPRPAWNHSPRSSPGSPGPIPT